MYTLHPDTTRIADNLCVTEYGISFLNLMKNAAKSCYDYIISRTEKGEKIVVLCGKGNNGGDGYELSSLLGKGGFDVTVINVFDCEPNTDTAKQVYFECIENGVSVLSLNDCKTALEKADVIIDSLFGVGFYGSVEKDSEIGKLLDFCNNKKCCIGKRWWTQDFLKT